MYKRNPEFQPATNRVTSCKTILIQPIRYRIADWDKNIVFPIQPFIFFLRIGVNFLSHSNYLEGQSTRSPLQFLKGFSWVSSRYFAVTKTGWLPWEPSGMGFRGTLNSNCTDAVKEGSGVRSLVRSEKAPGWVSFSQLQFLYSLHMTWLCFTT